MKSRMLQSDLDLHDVYFLIFYSLVMTSFDGQETEEASRVHTVYRRDRSGFIHQTAALA